MSTFDSVYASAVGVGLSNMIGYFVGGWFFYKLGLKRSLGFSFAVATIGGIFVMAIGLKHESNWVFPIIVAISKFGISIAY